jgi:hypothetical protein
MSFYDQPKSKARDLIFTNYRPVFILPENRRGTKECNKPEKAEAPDAHQFPGEP